MGKYPSAWVWVVCFGVLGWVLLDALVPPAPTAWQSPNLVPLFRTLSGTPEKTVFGILYFGVIPFALNK